jgi:hypothetical protein
MPKSVWWWDITRSSPGRQDKKEMERAGLLARTSKLKEQKQTDRQKDRMSRHVCKEDREGKRKFPSLWKETNRLNLPTSQIFSSLPCSLFSNASLLGSLNLCIPATHIPEPLVVPLSPLRSLVMPFFLLGLP